MAGPKTSAEKAREDEKNAVADDMFGGAFGGLEGMETPTPAPAEEPVLQEAEIPESETAPEEAVETPAEEPAPEAETSDTTEEPSLPPSGPPSGPPGPPPSGPPSGPPGPPPSGPPSGPPGPPPSGPPSGPPGHLLQVLQAVHHQTLLLGNRKVNCKIFHQVVQKQTVHRVRHHLALHQDPQVVHQAHLQIHHLLKKKKLKRHQKLLQL